MHEFLIPDMTCGHCVSKVRTSLKRFDPACDVQVDLSQHKVSVRSEEDRAALVEALNEAGYPPA
ncbi:MAG: heavy-metal-associated domain-containing protein [Hydrogenophaga sp.]|jgi:copper chaperone|uniref:heavy-metal-associated domain-containing protein n=1 Tax=Hydrogenophaga sp. TaxID=1904254 RepID=UPI0026039C76|nr:heavy-metal-associated domain-containing protein [Hydrogenophaga sp.]MCV0440540.1 heavy-metal-associated domain-containing protein [Hydrogenophaga sp.]